MGCAQSIPVAVGEPVGEPVAEPLVGKPVESLKIRGQLEFAPNQAKKPNVDYDYSNIIQRKHVRALRSTFEPIHQEGIRRRTPVELSPIRFILPEHWHKYDEDWPLELFSLTYSSSDQRILKKKSSEMISCIHTKYHLDEELLQLAAYLSEEKSKGRHEFMIRSEYK